MSKQRVSHLNLFHVSLIFLGFSLAIFTQSYLLTAVPGLHFDEAWQGLYAHRIATEDGFWPLQAMNSYTSPFLHYLLAFSFKIFGPSLQTMRLTLGIINLATLASFMGLLCYLNQWKAAWIFALIWALLPLSVHNHRFYIEMTSLHGLCFSVFLWATVLWKRHLKISALLFYFSMVLGTYTHILFLSVGLAALFWFLIHNKEPKKPATQLIGIISVSLLPLCARMAWDLKKISAFSIFLFVILLVFFSALALYRKKNKKLINKLWIKSHHFSSIFVRYLHFFCLPWGLAYILLFWNGFWIYTQVAGHLVHNWHQWIHINALLFVAILFIHYRSLKNELAVKAWQWFLLLFFFASLMMLKQSSRYYMIPTIMAMIWMALHLAYIKQKWVLTLILIFFTTWNLYAFKVHYIDTFQKYGGTDADFHLWIFKDSSRDFRPFQKAFLWAEHQGCAFMLHWVEDDRFLRPVQFLELSSPPPTKTCPWMKNEILFQHIPTSGFMPDFTRIAHEPQWGDLAFWKRNAIIKKTNSKNI